VITADRLAPGEGNLDRPSAAKQAREHQPFVGNQPVSIQEPGLGYRVEFAEALEVLLLVEVRVIT
jgi:hypothetical protein